MSQKGNTDRYDRRVTGKVVYPSRARDVDHRPGLSASRVGSPDVSVDPIAKSPTNGVTTEPVDYNPFAPKLLPMSSD